MAPPPEGILGPQNPRRRLRQAPRAHAQRLGLPKFCCRDLKRLGKTEKKKHLGPRLDGLHGFFLENNVVFEDPVQVHSL